MSTDIELSFGYPTLIPLSDAGLWEAVIIIEIVYDFLSINNPKQTDILKIGKSNKSAFSRHPDPVNEYFSDFYFYML